MSRSIVCAAFMSLSLAGSALAQNPPAAETNKGALPQPVGTTQVQEPAGVTKTDNAASNAGNTAPGVACQSESAEMTNGKVQTCAK